MRIYERIAVAASRVLGEDSYFATCDRDEKGHCVSAGGSGGGSGGEARPTSGLSSFPSVSYSIANVNPESARKKPQMQPVEGLQVTPNFAVRSLGKDIDGTERFALDHVPTGRALIRTGLTSVESWSVDDLANMAREMEGLANWKFTKLKDAPMNTNAVGAAFKKHKEAAGQRGLRRLGV